MKKEESHDSAAEGNYSLAGLAGAIRASLEQVDLHGRRLVAAVRVVGENLLEVKARINHGTWQDWVSKNTTLSIRNAQIYMQLTTRLAQVSEEEAQRVSHLPLRQALKALRGPGDSVVVVETDNAAPFERVHTRVEAPSPALRAAVARLDRLAADIDAGRAIPRSRLRSMRRSLEDALRIVCKLQETHPQSDNVTLKEQSKEKNAAASARQEMKPDQSLLPFLL